MENSKSRKVTTIRADQTLSYNAGVADICGIHAGIVFNHILYWLRANAKKKDVKIIDGHVWMYETQKEIAEFFGHLTEKEVRDAIKKLIDAGLIITRNLSKNKFDRTYSYSTSDPDLYLREKGNSKNSSEATNSSDRSDPTVGSNRPHGRIEATLRSDASIYNTIDNQEEHTKEDIAPTAAPLRKNSEFIFDPDKREFQGISEKDLQAWKELYPVVNIEFELKRMVEWCLSNPTRSKKQWRKFITNWLSKTNEELINKQARNQKAPHETTQRPPFSSYNFNIKKI